MSKKPVKWKEPKTPITASYARKLLGLAGASSILGEAEQIDKLARGKMAQLKLLRLCRKLERTGHSPTPP